MSFKVGDKVKAFGCEGIVTKIGPLGEMVTVNFNADSDFIEFFYPDGKLRTWHKEPSLVLVERAKKKVKLYPALLRRIGGYYVSIGLFESAEKAKEHFINDSEFIRLLTDDHHAVEIEE